MLQVSKPKLPSGFWHVPLLFSLFRKLSSLSNFRSDSNCMSGLASISRQGESIDEREPLRTQESLAYRVPWWLTFQGFGNGCCAPCFTANRGRYWCDGSGWCQTCRTNKELFSISGSFLESLLTLLDVDFIIHRIYTQTCMCTYKYIWQVPWRCRTTAHVDRHLLVSKDYSVW